MTDKAKDLDQDQETTEEPKSDKGRHKTYLMGMLPDPKEQMEKAQSLDIEREIEEIEQITPSVAQLAQLQKVCLVIFPHLGLNISKCARALGVGRRTIYNWLEQEPVFAELMQEMQEMQLDLVEERVNQIAMSNHPGSLTACIFLLNTQRPDRFQRHVKHDHEGTIRHVADPVSLDQYTQEQLPEPD